MNQTQRNTETLRRARRTNRAVVIELNGRYVVETQVSCGIAYLGDRKDARQVYNDPQEAWAILEVVERNNAAEGQATFQTVGRPN